MSDFLGWLTAIGTILAALVPAGLFLYERKDRKTAEDETRRVRERERLGAEKREAEAEAARIREQAEHVHFWAETLPGEAFAALWVVNTSPMPVTHVLVDGQAFGFDAWKEGQARRKARAAWLKDTVPPTDAQPMQFDGLPRIVIEGREALEPGWVTLECTLVEVRFTDAHGNRWSRKYKQYGSASLELLGEPDW